MDDRYIQGRLLAGEHILWEGRPAQGLLLTRRDALLIPSSLVFLGFSIYWTMLASNYGAPDFFALFGVLFIVAGLYFVVGRFLLDAWLRSRTQYAVTDRRVLVMRAAPPGRFTAVDRAKLPAIDLSERADGRGTIRFGAPEPILQGRNSLAGWTPSLDAVPQFLAIDRARYVFDLVQQPS
ncbi:PH domain-containing protein [Devosia sp. ZB163]|uniref:PH domain-containing protein n=1 Tax=Devosia sp. ZB163 TaxID=3025938 RepID=UPI0023601D61|nr:PH domain-containing protein [Devosia sp. ZB163]MDC9822710.1 PH domain-containing protein [Devosia sp. ZB163]